MVCSNMQPRNRTASRSSGMICDTGSVYVNSDKGLPMQQDKCTHNSSPKTQLSWFWSGMRHPNNNNNNNSRSTAAVAVSAVQYEMIATAVTDAAETIVCVPTTTTTTSSGSSSSRGSNLLDSLAGITGDDDSEESSLSSRDSRARRRTETRDPAFATEQETTPRTRPSSFLRFRNNTNRTSSNSPVAVVAELDLDKYMAAREMTPTQERWNAVTMIPNPLYCLYFLLSGNWVSDALVAEARDELPAVANNTNNTTFFFRSVRRLTGFGGLANDIVAHETHGCLQHESTIIDDNSHHAGGLLFGWIFAIPHNMPALPPLPVVAVAAAIVLHAPWSFLYHWKYAHSLSGTARTLHWSRRLDQVFIHVASALISYGTSGSWDYFFANCLFCADCVHRQFQHKVRPRRNQVRIAISFLAYCLPVLRRGDFELFGKLVGIMMASGWLFGSYPIGGWSHCVFHFVIALLPPLLMSAACELPIAQDQMKLAAQCVVYNERLSA